MLRRLAVLIAVIALVVPFLMPEGVVQAGWSNFRLINATCSGATLSVDYDGNLEGGPPNYIEFLVDPPGGGGIQTQQVNLMGATPPGQITATFTWAAIPEGSIIRVAAIQMAGGSGTSSWVDTDYTCSNTPSGGVLGTSTTASAASSSARPFVDPVVAEEQARGIYRLYNSINRAVVYLMPNGDVEFYRLQDGAGQPVGVAPASVMNPALYTPGQQVGRYTAPDGWSVSLFFGGWNRWTAIYMQPSGARFAEVSFGLGDPSSGQAGNGAGSQPVVAPPTEEPPSPPAPVVPPGVVIPEGGLPVVVQIPVNVRSAPDMRATRLRLLAQGTPVTLVGRDWTGGWVLGTLQSGQQGWMSMSFLSANLAQIRALPVVNP